MKGTSVLPTGVEQCSFALAGNGSNARSQIQAHLTTLSLVTRERAQVCRAERSRSPLYVSGQRWRAADITLPCQVI